MLGQFGIRRPPPAVGEKTEFQQVDRTHLWLSPLNPLPLGNVFLAPVAKLKRKARGIHLRCQIGEVVIDLTAEAADLGNRKGFISCDRTNSELCQHPYVPHQQFLQLLRITLRSEAVEDESHDENT